MSTPHHALGDPVELAALYASGAMTPPQAAAFEAHLAEGCADCTGELRLLVPAVQDLLSAIEPVEPGEAMNKDFLARLGACDQDDAEAHAHHPQVWRGWAGDSPGADILIRQASAEGWEDTGCEGVWIRRLSVDTAHNRMTALVRMAPGASYPGHLHDGPEECFVLEGDLDGGDHVLHAGDYERLAGGSRHGVQRTEKGCLLLIVSSLTDELT